MLLLSLKVIMTIPNGFYYYKSALSLFLLWLLSWGVILLDRRYYGTHFKNLLLVLTINIRTRLCRLLPCRFSLAGSAWKRYNCEQCGHLCESLQKLQICSHLRPYLLLQQHFSWCPPIRRLQLQRQLYLQSYPNMWIGHTLLRLVISSHYGNNTLQASTCYEH